MAMSRPLSQNDLVRGLECPVCHEPFRSPKMLPCGHTMCLNPCLEKISDGKSKMRCPECRTEHSTPKGGVKNFPSNISLARLIETHEPPVVCVGCPICGKTEELSKCLHCSLVVCELCRLNHTGKFKEQLKALLITMKEDTLPTSLTDYVRQKEKACTLLKENVQFEHKKLRYFANKVHAVIDDKVETLTKEIEDFHEEELHKLDQSSEIFQETVDCFTKFCSSSVEELKRKSHSQQQLATLMSGYKSRSGVISEEKNRISRLLREVSVRLNDVCYEKITQALGEVNILHFTEEENRCVEVIDSDAQLTMSSSLLERDLSSVKLCIGSHGSDDWSLSSPFGVVVDPETKNIIIADTSNNRIQIFDKHGEPCVRFGSKGTGFDQFDYPRCVCLTSEGNIVVSDTSNNRIKMHTRDGTFVCSFGKKGNGPAEFNFPYGLCTDNQGDIHVCDKENKRVQVFDSNGRYKYQYNTLKNAIDEKPRYISINRKGQILVVMSTVTAILNKKLQLLNSYKLSGDGVCWIDDKHYILSKYARNILSIHTCDGEVVKDFGEPGDCVGKLKGPRCVAMDEDGFVYVSCKNNMVQKF